MDKKLLLAVLCLQVFLLITTFTSSDAAALKTADLETADLGQPPHRQKGPVGNGKDGKWKHICLRFPRVCSPLPEPPKPTEDLVTIIRHKENPVVPLELETADLETADLRQPPPRQKGPVGNGKGGKWKPICLRFPRACGFFPKPKPKPTEDLLRHEE